MHVLRHHHIRPDEESVPLSRDAKAVEEDVANPGLIEESLSSVAGEGEFVRESVSIERLAFGSELLLLEQRISMWNTRGPLCVDEIPDKRHGQPPVRGTLSGNVLQNHPEKRHEPSACPGHPGVPLCGGQIPDKRHGHLPVRGTLSGNVLRTVPDKRHGQPPVRGTPGFLFVVARSRTNGTVSRLSGAPGPLGVDHVRTNGTSHPPVPCTLSENVLPIHPDKRHGQPPVRGTLSRNVLRTVPGHPGSHSSGASEPQENWSRVALTGGGIVPFVREGLMPGPA